MGQLNPTPECDFKRLSRAGCRFSCRGGLRIVAIGLFAAVVSTLAPSPSDAGIVIGYDRGRLTELQCPVYEESESLCDVSGSGAGPSSHQCPAPQKQQHEVPQIDPDAGLGEGGTSSTPAPSGGSSAPVAVVTDLEEVTTCALVCRIRMLEDLILDSPAPLGLLDPPKA